MPLAQPLLLPFARINGHELSRTSVDLIWDTFNIVGFTAIDFESVRAPGIAHGSQSKPQARTRGKVTFPCSVTIYETSWNVLRDALALKATTQRMGWSEVSSHVKLTYFEASLGPGSQLIELIAAQVLSAKQSISDADDQLTRVLTLSVMDILENGLSAVRENSPLGI